MTDLTPAIASPPADSRDWFRAAKGALVEGVGKWNDAKSMRNRQLGKFFYEAAVYCSKVQYAELETLAVDGFSVGRDQLTRFRTTYQRENQLPAPTPKSREAQRRSIAQPVGARETRQPNPPPGPTPADSGTEAGGGGYPAPPPGQDRQDVVGESAIREDAAPLQGVQLSDNPSPEASNKAQGSGPPPPPPSAPGSTSGTSASSGTRVRPSNGVSAVKGPEPAGTRLSCGEVHPKQDVYHPGGHAVQADDFHPPIIPSESFVKRVVRWLTSMAGIFNKLDDRDLDALERLIVEERKRRRSPNGFAVTTSPRIERPFSGPIPKVPTKKGGK